MRAGFDRQARLWQGARLLEGIDVGPLRAHLRSLCMIWRLRDVIKAEWGSKRQCPKCGTRFYDLMQDDPVTCINCGNSWVPEPILKSKQTLPFEVAKAEGQAVENEPALETDDLDIDADSDEPSEDADVDIGGDDDLSEVVVEDREEDR
jgi:uncharacterized protein (TIGR02300 family)